MYIPEFRAEETLSGSNDSFMSSILDNSSLSDPVIIPSQWVYRFRRITPKANGLGRACIGNCCSGTCREIKITANANGVASFSAVAKPAPGHTLSYWTFNGQYLGESNPISTTVNQPGTITAHFK